MVRTSRYAVDGGVSATVYVDGVPLATFYGKDSDASVALVELFEHSLREELGMELSAGPSIKELCAAASDWWHASDFGTEELWARR